MFFIFFFFWKMQFYLTQIWHDLFYEYLELYSSDVASDDAGRPAGEEVSDDVSEDDGKTTFQLNANTNLRPTSFNGKAQYTVVLYKCISYLISSFLSSWFRDLC